MGPEEASRWRPQRPNLLVTGTPGVGKSTLSQQVSQELGLRHVDVSAFACERDLVDEYDDKLQCHVLHEDAVLDALEPIMTDGGVILDHHSSDWFPERWVQAVVIITTDTAALYDRLEGRGYETNKLNNNIQAEIMRVVRDEAVESYPKAPVLELENSVEEHKQPNVNRIKAHYKALMTSRDQSVDSGPPLQ